LRYHPTVIVVVAALALAPAIALLVHEAGHALAALSVRARDFRVRLGTATTAWGARVVADVPDTTAARVAFFAAGPVASTVFGAACVVVGRTFDQPSIAIVGAVSVVFAVVCSCGSDGREVVRAFRE